MVYTVYTQWKGRRKKTTDSAESRSEAEIHLVIVHWKKCHVRQAKKVWLCIIIIMYLDVLCVISYYYVLLV